MSSILQLFDHGALNTVGGVVVDPLRQLLSAMEGAVAGSTSLLSLGEGRSSFVYQLLGERKYFLTLSRQNADDLNNIHAVDVSYPLVEGRSLIDPRQPDTADVAALDRYDIHMLPVIRQYPSNYHSQLFQQLDIRDSSGQPIQFSVIVSTYALSYVLLKDIPPKEMRPLIERVLTHLAPGGMILMTPIPRPRASLDMEAQIAAYNEIMDDLRNQGAITDFNRVDRDFRKNETPLVIIK